MKLNMIQILTILNLNHLNKLIHKKYCLLYKVNFIYLGKS